MICCRAYASVSTRKRRATVTAPKLRVFIDAEALFAGAAAPTEHGASLVLLRMAEITLIDAITSHQVIGEVERNLLAKLPAALPLFRVLVGRCLRVVPNPAPQPAGCADPADLPILVTALREECAWLVTFNVRHFRPGHPSIEVVRPGELVQRVRHLLARLKE
jgi:hypothetical protein